MMGRSLPLIERTKGGNTSLAVHTPGVRSRLLSSVSNLEGPRTTHHPLQCEAALTSFMLHRLTVKWPVTHPGQMDEVDGS